MHVVRKHANNVFETRAFVSFRQKKQAIINIRILHSQPTVAGCHYEESSFFLIFSVPIPTHSAAADLDRKSRNIRIHRFF